LEDGNGCCQSINENKREERREEEVREKKGRRNEKERVRWVQAQTTSSTPSRRKDKEGERCREKRKKKTCWA